MSLFGSDFPWQSSAWTGVVAGGLAAVGSMLIHGESPSAGGAFLGLQVPSVAAVGLSAGVGSMAADFANYSLKGQYSQDVSWNKVEDVAVGVVTSGGVGAALVMGSGGSSDAFFDAALLSAGSHAAAKVVAGPIMNLWQCEEFFFRFCCEVV